MTDLLSLSETWMLLMIVVKGNLPNFVKCILLSLFRAVKLCQDFLDTTTKEANLQPTYQMVDRLRRRRRSGDKTRR